MKRIAVFAFLLLLLGLLFPPPQSSTTRGVQVVSKQGQSIFVYKDYHALVMGVSKYEQWPKLPNAVNDAKEVAEKLKDLGFSVRLVLDPTFNEMRTALTDLVYLIGKEENRGVLFYYAGHGETETLADKTKMGYIIPINCPLLEKDPRGFATHAISMRDIEQVSLRIRSRHVLMLFDSCFSGALFSLVRAVPLDITEKISLPVRQYITAGREDEQVPDKSMFKRCLLVGLDGDADLTRDGYITGSELGMYLSDKVVNYTRSQQHPQYGKINNPDLDRGDFVFVPRKTEEVTGTEGKAQAGDRKTLEETRKEAPQEKEPQPASAVPPQISAIPKEVKEPSLRKIRLRDVPNKDFMEPSVAEMVKARNFYESTINRKGDFYNDFVDNGDGTVTDRATGLMWEKGGSSSEVSYYDAGKYIEQLNKKRLAGHGDWRIPTLEELCSLIEGEEKAGGSHMGNPFEDRTTTCWSSDSRVGPYGAVGPTISYVVHFLEGRIKDGYGHYLAMPGTTSSGLVRFSFVKAVRTVK